MIIRFITYNDKREIALRCDEVLEASASSPGACELRLASGHRVEVHGSVTEVTFRLNTREPIIALYDFRKLCVCGHDLQDHMASGSEKQVSCGCKSFRPQTAARQA